MAGGNVRLAFVLLGTLWACSCDDDGIVGAGSKLRTSTPRLDLGRVFVGTTGSGGFSLSAVGDVSLRFRGRYDGDQGPGWLVKPAEGSINANAKTPIVVEFRPIAPGPSSARVVFEAQGTGGSTVAVDLFATGVDPPDCEDGNGCTEDTFDLASGQCVHAVARLACDDFNACTSNDTCVEGICLGGSRSCDDGDICTDDLCDPRSGCLNVPTMHCADGNPCTADMCDPQGGCSSVVLDDGTPCDDFEQCTMADICLLGECIGVAFPEGAECDDGDPCSHMDQCVSGECKDPTYEPPLFGELKFATEVGALGRGAPFNPIVDRNSTVFFGTAMGVGAIDRCGDRIWTATIGATLFSGAVSLPGILSVPTGPALFDLDTETGAVIRAVDLAHLFLIPGSTTATAGVVLLDLAARASGGLVASLWAPNPPPGRGMIAEIDPGHSLSTPFARLGPRHVRRLAIDQDEAVIALVREGAPAEGLGQERLVRFGLVGLPETSWSTSERTSSRTDLALGAIGQVYWSSGLYAVDRQGTATALLAAPLSPGLIATGAPVVDQGRVYVIYRRVPPTMGLGATPELADYLLSIDAANGDVIFDLELPTLALEASPALDANGNVFVLTSRGTLLAYTSAGEPLFELEVPIGPAQAQGVALTLTPDRVVVGVTGSVVFGVQSTAGLGSSSWPRHRRDNFATGHR